MGRYAVSYGMLNCLMGCYTVSDMTMSYDMLRCFMGCYTVSDMTVSYGMRRSFMGCDSVLWGLTLFITGREALLWDVKQCGV